MRSSVFAPRPGSARSRSASAASLQLVERRHAELLPDPRGRLRAEAGQAHEEDDLGRDPVPALRQRVDLAVLDDLDDLLLDRLADPRQLLRPPVERELRDRARRLADARRRAAVGEHAERRLALELEQVGEQLELLRDLARCAAAPSPSGDVPDAASPGP